VATAISIASMTKVSADDVIDPRQPGHTPAVDLPSTCSEFGMHPRGSIAAVVLGVDGANLDHPASSARRSARASSVARCR
jgi:hypothetical protein